MLVSFPDSHVLPARKESLVTLVDFLGPGSDSRLRIRYQLACVEFTAPPTHVLDLVYVYTCSDMMAGIQCVACGTFPSASYRRRLDSDADVVAYVHDVVGLHTQDGAYVCRPCFLQLKKGSKAASTLRSLIEDTRRSLGLADKTSFEAMSDVIRSDEKSAKKQK